MEDDRRHKYALLKQMIENNVFKSKANFEDIERFVERENITPEECHRLKVFSPLCTAARFDSPDMLKYIISLGFDPNAPLLGNGEMPIHAACMAHLYDDVDGEDEDEDEVERRKKQATANNFEVVRILVKDYKVDVNVRNKSLRDFTPLLYAASTGRLEVVKLLLEVGANLKARDNFKDWTPLHLAAMSGSPEVCEYLLCAGLYVDVTDASERRPLHHAAFNGHVKAAEVLLDAGADVNGMDSWDCSPLGSAFMSEDLDVIRLLCSRGANIRIDPKTGEFLIDAINRDDYDMVRYFLVEKGVSPNAKAFSETTAFSAAMKIGNMKAAKLLIACGCSIDKDACDSDEYILRDSPEEWDSEEWESFVEDVQKMSDNPRTLQEICCIKIRSRFGDNIVDPVNALRIPNALKDVLLLTHV